MTNPLDSILQKALKNMESQKTPACLSLEILGLYIEGKLPAGEKITAEEHIGSCLYCLNQLTELKELIYFQRQNTPLPFHLRQRINELFPKQEIPKKELWKDIFSPLIQTISDFFAFPFRQWRYATVSLATALAVILIMTIYKGATPEKPSEIEKILRKQVFTTLSLKEVKNPIIIETGDIENTFEQVRRLIQTHNGKMIEATWIEKGIMLIFNLGREEETSLFNELSKLGRVKIEKEGYRDKKGNIVVLLKER
jgi:hypothetical protein